MYEYSVKLLNTNKWVELSKEEEEKKRKVYVIRFVKFILNNEMKRILFPFFLTWRLILAVVQ